MQPKSSAAVVIRRTATAGLLAALLAAWPVRPGAAAKTTLALVGGTVIDGTGTPPQADAEAIASFDDLGRLPEGLLPAWSRRRTPGPLDRVETANLRRVEADGNTVAAGSDAGNIGTLHGPALIRSSRSRSWR